LFYNHGIISFINWWPDKKSSLCGFWSLGQSEYKVYHSSTKTILCKGRWNSGSKSRLKSKEIWT
jgi:hypothetical protein